MKNKKAIVVYIIIALVIIVPIVWQKTSTFLAGMKTAKLMSMPKRVSTVDVVENEINYKDEYVGRIIAEKEMKVVSRINGWLQKKYFTEGEYVKEGQVLCLIEPDEYILAVKNAQADYNRAKAVCDNAGIELKRAQELVKGDYVSRSYYDNAFAQYSTSKAAVDAAKAVLDKAKLNLSYTKIKAPYSGRIGNLIIPEGNYVTAQTGELASLVTIDPIFASFTVKSEDIAKFRNNETKSNIISNIPDVTVQLKLNDGTIYDEPGKLDFVDNKIDQDLGTIKYRATFENKKQQLVPNDFVRVIIKANFKSKVVLVPQEVVLENVSSKYVWMIDENNCAKQQNIKVNGQHEKQWIVTEGLEPGQRVISTNLQTMYQGAKVQVVQQEETQNENK